MTGTVHDRAIAEELRSFQKLVFDEYELNELFARRINELEATAPPATIDASYAEDEPPVGTVIEVSSVIPPSTDGTDQELFVHRAWYDRDGTVDDGWWSDAMETMVDWNMVVKFARDGFSNTVLRWGLE